MRPTPLHDQAVAVALGRSEPLSGLLQRVAASRRRYEAVVGLLPPGLRAGTRPGPLDDTTWVLLAANAAAAAKLRQLLPQLQQQLLADGWPGLELKIRIRSAEPASGAA